MKTAKEIKADFAIKTFALAVTNKNPDGGVIKSGGTKPVISCGNDCAETYEYGDKATLTAVPSAGYVFNGWGGSCKDKDNTCTVTMTDSDKAVTADFKIKTFNLTAKVASGTGTVSINPQGSGADNMTYNYGDVVTITASPDISNKFKDWTDDCDKTKTDTCILTMNKARKATAKFETKKFDLKVSRNDTKGGKVTGSGINCGSDCKGTYDYGKTVTLTATANDAYTFTGWPDHLSDSCSGTGSCTVTMKDAVSVTANFTIKTFSLNATNSNPSGGTITASGISCGGDCSETYNYNTSVTLTANAAAGNDFTGWGGACSGSQKTCTVKMGANKTITAGFKVQTFSIAASVTGSGGSISPSGTTTITYGGSQTYYITPKSGYQIAGVTVDGSLVGAVSSYTFSSVTAKHTIKATFSIISYQLSVTNYNPSGGVIKGSGFNCGSACSKAFDYGKAVTLTADPNTGYNFSGWGGACSGTGSCTVTMDGAKGVTANFSIKTYSLSVSSSNGIVTGTGIYCGSDCSEGYAHGTSVTLSASPNTGYNFKRWTGDCSGGSCTLNMKGNKSVTATYEIQTFDIKATAGDNGKISPSGTKTVNYNGSQTYSISPNKNYQIADVVVDGSSVGTVSSYTFSSITAGHTIKATFKRK